VRGVARAREAACGGLRGRGARPRLWRMSAVPYLSYPDAAAILDWITALGGEVLARQDGDDGNVVHSEVRVEGAVLMVASDDAAYEIPPLRGESTGAGVYLVTERVDELHDAAVSAGGRSVIAPEDTGWGARRARVLDPAGREWSFGSYRPGSA